MQQNQEIRCTVCDTTYDLEKLGALKMFDMQCPTCKEGICRVNNLSRKYEGILNAVAPDLLLPPTELGILQTLQTEKRGMYAGEIAAELDKSYQLVGKRGKTLAERGLVSRDLNDAGRRVLDLTSLAKSSYFAEGVKDTLEVPPEESTPPQQ
jgi:DNA-binding MarR family transcriptional regulator